MNKIIILTSFLFIFSMKINAYEYKLYEDISGNDNSNRYFFYTDSGGHLWIKRVTQNGNVYTYNNYYYTLNNIKFGNHRLWITTSQFRNYFTSDLKFLNDLYQQMTIPFLNYFYNEQSFNTTNYINYENYQILYNSEGLAVESIVNGVWRGLYSSSDKSGYLYDKKGNLVYIDGVEASFFEKLSNKFLKPFKFNLESIFIRKIWYSLLVFIFAVVILRTVIRMAFQAFLIRFYDKKVSQAERQRDKIANA